MSQSLVTSGGATIGHPLVIKGTFFQLNFMVTISWVNSTCLNTFWGQIRDLKFWQILRRTPLSMELPSVSKIDHSWDQSICTTYLTVCLYSQQWLEFSKSCLLTILIKYLSRQHGLCHLPPPHQWSYLAWNYQKTFYQIKHLLRLGHWTSV